MRIIKNICRSVLSPLQIINIQPIKGKLSASIILVTAAALLGSVLEPVLYYYKYKNQLEISISYMGILIAFTAGMLTWATACLIFWLLARLFKKQVSFKAIASTWGFSYFPNLLCVIAYSLLQLNPKLFIGNAVLGFILNTFFIMLLIWKAIYYFIEMKYVIRTTGFELLTITLTAGIAFWLLMWAGFLLGIQVPML